MIRERAAIKNSLVHCQLFFRYGVQCNSNITNITSCSFALTSSLKELTFTHCHSGVSPRQVCNTSYVITPHPPLEGTLCPNRESVNRQVDYYGRFKSPWPMKLGRPHQLWLFI